MNRFILALSVSFFLTTSLVNATLLVDVPLDLDNETKNKVIACLFKNSFPTMTPDEDKYPEDWALKQRGIAVEEQYQYEENDRVDLEKIEKHFSTFSGGTFLRTPESTFVEQALKSVSLPYSVIQIPSTLYDLEVTAHLLNNIDFMNDTFTNTQWGDKNATGIKNYSSVDQRYLSLSPGMYKIYSTYTEKDFLNRAEELIRIICEAECGDSPSKAKNLFKATQKTLSEKIAKTLILRAISHELKSQKEGKINFYRGSAGIKYEKGGQTRGKTLASHPTRADSKLADTNFLKTFLCDESYCKPPLSEHATDEELVDAAEKYNDHEVLGPKLKAAARNIREVGHIIDFPFQYDLDKINQETITQIAPKELSYNYTLLGGFLFDGVTANISSCPLVFAIKDRWEYPYLYTISWKLPDFYKYYSRYFTLPKTPLYQVAVDSGEGYHPRLNIQNNTLVETGLEFFYDNIKILGFAGEDADQEENIPFVEALQHQHQKLIRNSRLVMNFNPEKEPSLITEEASEISQKGIRHVEEGDVSSKSLLKVERIPCEPELPSLSVAGASHTFRTTGEYEDARNRHSAVSIELSYGDLQDAGYQLIVNHRTTKKGPEVRIFNPKIKGYTVLGTLLPSVDFRDTVFSLTAWSRLVRNELLPESVLLTYLSFVGGKSDIHSFTIRSNRKTVKEVIFGDKDSESQSGIHVYGRETDGNANEWSVKRP